MRRCGISCICIEDQDKDQVSGLLTGCSGASWRNFGRAGAQALYFVQPRTVTTWQKKRFRDYWRALSQSTKTGRPRISPELRKLIGRMWEANPTWGAPKIVAELAMLGIDVAKSTVEKYKPKRTGPPSPTWRTFLDQHVRDLVSIDFFIVPTATFRVLFVFIVLNERHLKRLMSSYLDYYHPWRTHQSLNSDAPDGRPVRVAESCNVVEFPAVHGLHHVHIPKAA